MLKLSLDISGGRAHDGGMTNYATSNNCQIRPCPFGTGYSLFLPSGAFWWTFATRADALAASLTLTAADLATHNHRRSLAGPCDTFAPVDAAEDDSDIYCVTCGFTGFDHGPAPRVTGPFQPSETDLQASARLGAAWTE